LASAGLVAVGPASAANFTVSNANDSGANSLRQAVIDANGNIDPSNAIDFSLPMGSTITLTGGQIAVSKTLTLTGPGNNGITISGNLADRIFDVTPTVAVDPNDRADTELIIEGLTLRNGRVTGNGGCIQATPNEYNNVSLTLVNSIVTGCSAESTDTADNTFPLDFTNGAFNPSGMGGGIFAANVDIEPDQGFIPTVSLIDSTVSGNTARIAGGGLVGGAVYAQRSRISDNSVLGGEVTAIVGGNAGKYSVFTTGTGGGLLSLVADLESSTISGNSVNTVTFPAIPNGPSQPFQVGSAGGIHAIFGFEVRNSTISGNIVRATTPDATTYAVLLLGGA